MILVREEKQEDIPKIRTINECAFGQPMEGNIIDQLRENCDDVISLVSVDGDEVVGHILFSPAVIDGEHDTVTGMGLTPMAVVPERQRQGIGSALVRHNAYLKDIKSKLEQINKNVFDCILNIFETLNSSFLNIYNSEF
jgi:putative acetyltransferase